MNSSGHPFGPGPTATISENSPRADVWRTIFGGLTAPIKSAVPQRCEIARSVSLVYWLDIGRIDSEMMDRLVAHAQAQSAGVVPHEQVRLVLVAEGMPIHYDDVSTITDEHPETIVAGLEAEIAKATASLRKEAEHGGIRAKLDMRPTLEIDRLMDPLQRKAEEHAKRVPSANEFYETPMGIRHAALDAMFVNIADRMDAQAGFAPTSKVQTVDKPYKQPRLILTVAGAPPNSTLAALIGQHVGSHAFSPMMVNTPNGPEPIKHDPERTRADVLRIRDEGLRAIQEDFAETYAIPEGASIGDVAIPAGNMTAQQIAEMIGGEVIDAQTIRGPSLAIASAPGRIVFAANDLASDSLAHAASDFASIEQDISSELSSGDGLPPALCSCLTDGTLRGPFCQRIYVVESMVRGEDDVNRRRKHGGPARCPRPCSECRDGAHHFCEVDIQPVFALTDSDDGFDEEELEEVQTLRKHPAHLAGCESWYECRHCDAWMEASDDDDMDADDAPMNECDECGEDYAECDCDPDSDDYGPDSDEFDDDEDDCDDEEESSHNEPDPHPNTQDVSSMVPSNDRQSRLLDVGPPARPVAVPRWASELARDLLHAARFLGLVAVRVPNNVQFQWAHVIADWPNEVQASVHAWLNTPQDAAHTAKDNVPTAVRALVDQANAGGES